MNTAWVFKALRAKRLSLAPRRRRSRQGGRVDYEVHVKVALETASRPLAAANVEAWQIEKYNQKAKGENTANSPFDANHTEKSTFAVRSPTIIR